MGRTILIDVRNGSGGNAERFAGTASIQPTSIHDKDAARTLPAPFTVALEAGQGQFLDVSPSPEGDSPEWVYKITINDPQGVSTSILAGVPDGGTPVQLAALPVYEIIPTSEGAGYVQINKDTGPLNIRHLWGGAGGSLTLTRSGNWVELAAWGVPFVADNQYQMQVPDGFRPPDIRLFNEAIYGDGNPPGERMNVRGDGNIQVLGVTAGNQIYFTVHWYTHQGMPLELPGT